MAKSTDLGQGAFLVRRHVIRHKTLGTYHDLNEIYHHVNNAYFGGTVTATVEWGRHRFLSPSKHVTVKLGVCYCTTRRVRIHRSLDREFVPRVFVECVVAHELLHIVHPPLPSGPYRFHHAAFRAAERALPIYQEAIQWEEKNIDKLLFF